MYRNLFLRTLGLLAVVVMTTATAAFAQEGESERAAEKGPLHIGFVVNNSGGFRTGLERAVRILSAVAKEKSPADMAFVVTFSDAENISVKQEITAEEFLIRDEIENIYAEPGAGALWDAIYRSAELLSGSAGETEPRARVLIVVTDGDDRASATKPGDLGKQLASANIKLVFVGMSDTTVNSKPLDRMVKDAGATKLLVEKTDAVDAVAAKIVAILGGF